MCIETNIAHFYFDKCEHVFLILYLCLTQTNVNLYRMKRTQILFKFINANISRHNFSLSFIFL
jgi:hypothetical protein